MNSEYSEIKKYANLHLFTDIEPYEVVRKISDMTVEIRKMDYVQTKFPKEFHKGGFSGYYSDNEAQEYEYSSNPENKVVRIRYSKSRKGWFRGSFRHIMSDKPRRFYDYNF